MDREFAVGNEVPFGSDSNLSDNKPLDPNFSSIPRESDPIEDLKKSPKKSSASMMTIILVVLTVFSLSGAVSLYLMKETEVNNRLKVEAELEAMTLQKEEAERELQDIQIVKKQVENDLSKTRVDFQRTLAELSDKEAEVARLAKELDGSTKMVDSLKVSLSTKDKEQAKIENSFKEANRDLQHLKVQLSQIRMAKDSLENRIIQLTKSNRTNSVELEEIVVDEAGETEIKKKIGILKADDYGHFIPLPTATGLEGQVLVVNDEFAFVVINIGEKDGLKETAVLGVYRGQSLLGKVQVERIYDTMSSAVIILESLNGDIKEGDAVKLI